MYGIMRIGEVAKEKTIYRVWLPYSNITIFTYENFNPSKYIKYKT